MQGIIKNNPDLKMIVELFPIGLGRVGSSLEEFVGTLQQHFRLFTVDRDGSVCFAELADIQKAVKKTAVINLFCSRN
jgi:Ca2+-binding EF-hand superfamily protein